MKKHLPCLLVITLYNLSQTVVIAKSNIQNSNNNLFQIIAQENLKSVTKIQEVNVLDTLTGAIDALNDGTIQFHEYLKRTLEIQCNPPPEDKRREIFTLMCSYEKNHPIKNQPNILDYKSWQELELLCGPKSNPAFYVASKLDRTNTEIGRVTLYKKIIQPIHDCVQLENQKKLIQTLVSDQRLFNELDDKIKGLVKAESVLLSFWQEDFFFSLIQQSRVKIPWAQSLSNYINKNELALEANYQLSQLTTLFSLACMTTGAITLSLQGIALITKHTAPESLKNFNKALGFDSPATAISIFGLCCFLLNKIKNQTANGASNIITGVSNGANAWGMLDEFRIKNVTHHCLRTKLMHVATYVNNMCALGEFVAKNRTISHLMPEIKHFNTIIDELSKKSHEFDHLLALLASDTFKSEPSFIWFSGRIQATYSLLHQFKDMLIPAMIAVGNLDAQLSIAKLYKEFEGKPITFCFPTYIPQEKSQGPALEIKDFWHPSLEPTKVVPNSLSLGQYCNTSPGAIITGPNAGGKSTITKAAILCTILAQSFGIAPAQSISLTPFSKIITYLNITDDIAEGNSHFKAGVLRAHDILTTAQQCESYNYMLTALDEVFNGTTFKEGQAAAYSLIKQLGQNQNVMCITNTHFPVIPTLENTKNFTNYKVSVNYSDTGTIIYPYKLEPGISNQIVTLKILRQEDFGDEFLEEAERILKTEGTNHA